MLRDIFDKEGPGMIGVVLCLIIMVGLIFASSYLLVL
jgi:hypothetical protein